MTVHTHAHKNGFDMSIPVRVGLWQDVQGYIRIGAGIGAGLAVLIIVIVARIHSAGWFDTPAKESGLIEVKGELTTLSASLADIKKDFAELKLDNRGFQADLKHLAETASDLKQANAAIGAKLDQLNDKIPALPVPPPPVHKHTVKPSMRS